MCRWSDSIVPRSPDSGGAAGATRPRRSGTRWRRCVLRRRARAPAARDNPMGFHLFSPRLFGRIRPLVRAARAVCPPILWQAAYKMATNRGLPDAERYGILYQPWREPEGPARLYGRIEAHAGLPRSLHGTSVPGCGIRWPRIQGKGAVYELGVYKERRVSCAKGRERRDALRLFDTFAGMEHVDPALGDRHRTGDFADTSLAGVKAFVGSRISSTTGSGGSRRRFGELKAMRSSLRTSTWICMTRSLSSPPRFGALSAAPPGRCDGL